MMTHNLLEHTKEALNSLTPALVSGYEVIFVDNGSTDGTPEFLQNLDLPITKKLILNKENLGIAHALNQAFGMAVGKYIYRFDNDLILKDFLMFERMAHYFKDYEGIGIVAAKTNKVFTKLQQCRDSTFLNHHVISVLKVDLLSAMISKECWEEVGGFDEDYKFGNYEDTDFCMKVKKARFKILIDGHTFIYHKGSLTFKTFGFNSALKQNKKRFLEKWGSYPKEEVLGKLE